MTHQPPQEPKYPRGRNSVTTKYLDDRGWPTGGVTDISLSLRPKSHHELTRGQIVVVLTKGQAAPDEPQYGRVIQLQYLDEPLIIEQVELDPNPQRGFVCTGKEEPYENATGYFFIDAASYVRRYG